MNLSALDFETRVRVATIAMADTMNGDVVSDLAVEISAALKNRRTVDVLGALASLLSVYAAASPDPQATCLSIGRLAACTAEAEALAEAEVGGHA
jgi:hypothetical protein